MCCPTFCHPCPSLWPIPGYCLPVLIVSFKRYLVPVMDQFLVVVNRFWWCPYNVIWFLKCRHSQLKWFIFSPDYWPEAREYQNLAGKPQPSKGVKFNTLLTHHTKWAISAKPSIFKSTPAIRYFIGYPISKYHSTLGVNLTHRCVNPA